MADRSEFDRGLEQGLRMGRLEGQLFDGLPRIGPMPGARFAFKYSLFDSYADYERQVVANLRAIQRLRWKLERGNAVDPGAPLPELGAAELRRLESVAKRELWRARDAVDAEREEGRGRACVVEAMRASPQTPATVLEYEAREFAEEDPRRAAGAEVARAELIGADFGMRWSLENPFRRWECSRWRISWLCGARSVGWWEPDALHSDAGEATTEVYAAELNDGGGGSGRVWLLGKIRTLAALERALKELERHASDERNSLVAAANAVARVSREEGWVQPSNP